MTDLDARCFIRKGNSLVAADFAAEEFLAGIPQGREVTVTVRRPRSPKHHRWFFKLLREVVSNTDDRWANEDDLLDDLKLACGHFTRRANIMTGEIQYVAKSINFASMSEDKFCRFKDRALYVLAIALGYDPLILMDGEREPTRSVPGPTLSPPEPPVTAGNHQGERV